MAGHLLKTTNPEAAARLEAEGEAKLAEMARPAAAPVTNPITDPAKPYVPPKPLAMVHPREPVYTCDRVPSVGEIVRYHARPGQGRAGKSEFSAMVLHCDSRGVAELLVFFSADDLSEMIMVAYRSDETPWPAWSFIENSEVAELANRFSAFLGIAERLSHKIDAVETLFGDRLEVLEARKVDLSPITKRLDALEGSAPEKAKK